MLEQVITAKLAEYQDPFLGKSLQEARLIKQIKVTASQILIDLIFPYPIEDIKTVRTEELRNYLEPYAAGRDVVISLTTKIENHAGKHGIPALPNIKNIIAVASGKGGVGKSTVAVNTALALAQAGAKVGILDADIYGPSQPTMLGTEKVKPVIEDKQFVPVMKHGVQSMSIGYLVEETSALVWRGPMIGKAMQQLIHDTRWDALDYLIVDLPPGTGDIQLTLCQKIPVSGAIIVTTPQDLALADVRRACEMFNKLNVPILGIIENMSTFHCPQCGHESAVFGEGGGMRLQEEYQVNLLDKIPLNIDIRQRTDSGEPPIKPFLHAARKAAALLALQPKDYSAKFPKVVVEKK